jgi:hypothetical protein
MIMYTEFLAATIEACGRIEDDRLAEAFDRLDCDDTGYSKSDSNNCDFSFMLGVLYLKFIYYATSVSEGNLRELLGPKCSDAEIKAIIEVSYFVPFFCAPL